MAFLKATLSPEPSPLLRGDRVMLRPLAMSDYSVWAELRAKSRQHLVPWEPAWSNDELTKSAFRLRVRVNQRDMRDDLGYALLIRSTVTNELLGGASLSNIRRGAAQTAALGYWIGAQHAGRGYMTEAAALALSYAFDTLTLHRVEAACMPANSASIGVLSKLGFRREGLARHYLRINGTWQDHVLFGLVADEWRAVRADTLDRWRSSVEGVRGRGNG